MDKIKNALELYEKNSKKELDYQKKELRKYYDYFVKIGNEYFDYLNEFYTALDKSNMFDKAWEVDSSSVTTCTYHYCYKDTYNDYHWVRINVTYEPSMISQINIYFITSDTYDLDIVKSEVAKSKVASPFDMTISFKYVNGYITNFTYFQYIKKASLLFSRDSTVSDDIEFEKMCKAYECDTRNQTIENYTRILDCLKGDLDDSFVPKEYVKKTHLDEINFYVEDTIIDEIKKNGNIDDMLFYRNVLKLDTDKKIMVG